MEERLEEEENGLQFRLGHSPVTSLRNTNTPHHQYCNHNNGNNSDNWADNLPIDLFSRIPLLVHRSTRIVTTAPISIIVTTSSWIVTTLASSLVAIPTWVVSSLSTLSTIAPLSIVIRVVTSLPSLVAITSWVVTSLTSMASILSWVVTSLSSLTSIAAWVESSLSPWLAAASIWVISSLSTTISF